MPRRALALAAAVVVVPALIAPPAGAAPPYATEAAEMPGPGAGPPSREWVTTFGPYKLKPGELMQVPPGAVIQKPCSRPLWFLGYSTEVVDMAGTVLDKEYHCHTMMWTRLPDSKMQGGMDGVPFKGLFSDGYTTEFRVPDGHGVFCDQGEMFELMLAFNNRDTAPLTAAYRVTFHYVFDSDLKEPLRPLYAMLQSVVNPHLYTVEPGRDVREREFRFPFEGALHSMAVHIHPYGREVKLVNEAKDETVWQARGVLGDDHRLLRMPFYLETDGYAFTPDDTFNISVTYDNPTDVGQDAMAGLVILFSTPDGTMPVVEPPAPEASGAEGHEHHGSHGEP